MHNYKVCQLAYICATAYRPATHLLNWWNCYANNTKPVESNSLIMSEESFQKRFHSIKPVKETQAPDSPLHSAWNTYCTSYKITPNTEEGYG